MLAWERWKGTTLSPAPGTEASPSAAFGDAEPEVMLGRVDCTSWLKVCLQLLAIF